MAKSILVEVREADEVAISEGTIKSGKSVESDGKGTSAAEGMSPVSRSSLALMRSVIDVIS